MFSYVLYTCAVRSVCVLYPTSVLKINHVIIKTSSFYYFIYQSLSSINRMKMLRIKKLLKIPLMFKLISILSFLSIIIDYLFCFVITNPEDCNLWENNPQI